MPQLTTLRDLRVTSRRRSALRGNQTLSDPDFNAIINDSIARIWEAATAADIGYGEANAPLVTVAGQEEYALPVDHAVTRDFLRQLTTGGNQRAPAERTTESSFLAWALEDNGNETALPGMYWYTQTGIVLRPIPTSIENNLLLYVQTPPVLILDTDTIDTVINWKDCIVEYACAEAVQSQRKRQAHAARAEMILNREISAWGTKRDRGPDFVGKYRNGRGSQGGYGW